MIAAHAFLQTILEQPEADAPRLVYADWLDEQGNPLGELVRVQCQLACLHEKDPRREPLCRRQEQLFEQFGPLWHGPVQELGLSGKFQRGLFEVTVTGARTLLDVADRLFALPSVLHVNLRDGALDRDTLRALAKSPVFQRLRQLDLQRSHVTNDGINILCSSPYRGRFTKLMLGHTQISSLAARLLVNAFDLSNLTELSLCFNGIGEGGARHLAKCPQLTRLRVLDLSNNRIQSDGAVYLAESQYLNQLRLLDVRGNNIRRSAKRSLRGKYGPRVQISNTGYYSF
ncbi:MAG TPA: TIGR02996 domain-containing protein [Gemmataceae bacterium]|nr:TIGR02996 domain-containing protein [Gemmataceae bacterium]